MSLKEEFPTILLCEDIREEINHKRILIGVFSGDIVVDKFPVDISATLYMEHLPTREGVHEYILTIGVGSKVIGKIEMKAFVGAPISRAVVPTPRFGTKLEKETEIYVDVETKEDGVVRLLTKRVYQGVVQGKVSVSSIES